MQSMRYPRSPQPGARAALPYQGQRRGAAKPRLWAHGDNASLSLFARWWAK